jgi:hypothetical protein
MVAQTNNLSALTDGKVAAAVAPLSLPRLYALRVGYLALRSEAGMAGSDARW